MLGSLEYQVECGEWEAILGLCEGVLCTELERVGKLGHQVAGGEEEWTECWQRE